LNRKVLERAAEGQFLQLEVNRGLPERYLHKYFRRSGSAWQISDHVRKMISFEQFDFRDSPARLAAFDAVLCRNVLIYFDLATKKRIVGQIRRALRDDGFLMLGCAENPLNVSADFEKLVFGSALFYQVCSAARPSSVTTAVEERAGLRKLAG